MLTRRKCYKKTRGDEKQIILGTGNEKRQEHGKNSYGRPCLFLFFLKLAPSSTHSLRKPKQAKPLPTYLYPLPLALVMIKNTDLQKHYARGRIIY